MQVIALTGKMGVGKSTAVDVLLDDYSGKIRLVKFAQPIYDIQEYAYGRISTIYQRPSDFVKDRKFLQFIGTEWGRGVHQSLWIDLWKHYVKNSDANVVICDDLRYDNEADAVKSLGGVVIKITSDKNLDRITTANGIPNHASEAGIDEKFVDYFVSNCGTMQAYRHQLCAVYDSILDKAKT